MSRRKRNLVESDRAISWSIPSSVVTGADGQLKGVGQSAEYVLTDSNAYPLLESFASVIDKESARQFVEEWGFPLPPAVDGVYAMPASTLVGLANTIELIWKICGLREGNFAEAIKYVEFVESFGVPNLINAKLRPSLAVPGRLYLIPSDLGQGFIVETPVYLEQHSSTYHLSDYKKTPDLIAAIYIQEVLKGLLNRGLQMQQPTVDWEFQPSKESWSLVPKYIPKSPWSLLILELLRQATGPAQFRRCAVCGSVDEMIGRRADAKTCSDLCRKLLSDRNKKQRGKK